jgi:F-type H+-transporting ATPase subunit delta
MTEKRIAQRYAKALFLIAEEGKTMDTMHQDIVYIQNVLHTSNELSLLLKNPIINPAKKIKIINAIFDKNVQDIVIKFLVFIIKKGRGNLLPYIITEFLAMYNEAYNLIEVEIISAHQLNEKAKNEIIATVAKWINKEVIPIFQVNPKIIGGIQLKFEDYLYDASLKKQLETLNNILSY